MSVFVIGEMASAHDGDIRKAKQLIDFAAETGCNAVKVQFWSDADRLADRRRVPKYYRDIYKKYQIPVEWMSVLKDYCGERIEFMATCFLPEDATVVSRFVKRMKVSAFESHSTDVLHAAIAEAGDRQVIVSINEAISPAVKIRQQDALLHCVTAYPATLPSMHLRSIWRLVGRYSHHAIGYSDHSGDPQMGAYAVCAGATIIEAHMKLIDTDGLNPDGGAFAHLPKAFAEYVQNIRKAELAVGQSVHALSVKELEMRQYRSVVR